MAKQSAGVLLFRKNNVLLEFFLVHPGGPFWKNKDVGAWSIPKGEFEADENPLVAAKRELREETGIEIEGNFIELTPVKQKSGKTIYVWAVEGNAEIQFIESNLFDLEWPPKSGRIQHFVEVDRGEWFFEAEALKKISPGQQPFLLELVAIIPKR